MSQLADALRNAREAKGISQRELSADAAVAQGHISRIESGAVDLRLSSLVALARALDLELVLVPRRSVAAVRSIAGSAALSAEHRRVARQVRREFARLQRAMDDLSEELSSETELTELRHQVRALQRFRPSLLDQQVIRQATQAVKALMRDPRSCDAVRRSSLQLRRLRDALAHGRTAGDTASSAPPAYTLDDDDDG
ncbi:MAG: helix-turn-helix transcriptional regulator [Acidobacteria bacterium]|nr:helix-turn-helix transcriptional regulator [Acidobacteriota bacterium]